MILCVSAAEAQERPVRWRVEPGTARVGRGAEFRLSLVATIDTGWKLYSIDPQKGGPIATTISLGDTSRFTLARIDAPAAEEYPDRNFDIFTFIYTEAVRMRLTVRASRDAPVGRSPLPVLVLFQTCTDRYCLPPRTDTLTVAVQVLDRPVVADASPATIAPVVAAPPPNPAPPAVALNVIAPTDFASLLRFVWLAVTMGLLSLLTPCILPMIPVTVSYFGGARQSPRGRAVAALAHALGIVGVFTLLGFAIATIFGAGGIVRLAASPWLNFAIAALFVAFALNLLGVFEITLPQRVLARASAIGADGHRHTAGALLMGAAFAITSFTCTVPFVGTLLVLATQGSWRWPLIGLAAYGAAFALPFVLLALAPRMLDRIPRGGEWMLTLKRSLAIAELALAVKFLSNVDLVLGARVLTREVVLVTWIVAAGAIAVLAVRRRSAPSVAMGVLALALAGVLVTGLRGRRLGELEAYLPPRTGGSELAWMLNDYDGALARAQAERRLVLLDFTGYTCTNCRWMEANMFPRDDVARQLERFVRVRLFTDGRGEPYATQQRFQLERFGTVALPYYAVVDGGGAPRATFLGMTRDSREFSRFLEQALSDSPGGSP